MHGTKTYLPDKIKFLSVLSRELKADAIAFNYRGFGQSEGEEPEERNIKLDTDTIATFFREMAKPG